MKRDEILCILRELGSTQWRLADAIGISEPTLTRWLRYPITGERLKKVQSGIELLRKEVNK